MFVTLDLERTLERTPLPHCRPQISTIKGSFVSPRTVVHNSAALDLLESFTPHFTQLGEAKIQLCWVASVLFPFILMHARMRMSYRGAEPLEK